MTVAPFAPIRTGCPGTRSVPVGPTTPGYVPWAIVWTIILAAAGI